MKQRAAQPIDVLLVQPPLTLPRRFANYPSLADLGLLQAAAVLRERGHRVRVVDALLGRGDALPLQRTRKGLRFGLPVRALAPALRDGPADAVVLAASLYASPRQYGRTALPALARALRRMHPDAALILADCHIGGVDHLPYDPRAVLDEDGALDFVLPGEAERSLPALVEGAASGQGRVPPGAAYRRGRKAVLAQGEEPRVERLDELPLPAFDLVGGPAYLAHQARAAAADLIHEHPEPRRLLPLMTSRGCPFTCSFCAGRAAGSWRGHSVRYLRERIVPLARELRAEGLLLLDDCINADARRFTALAEALADAGLPWDALNGLRGDRVSERALAAMVRAGCRKLTCSAESGDPEVLQQQVGKRLDLGKLERTVAAAHAAGLRTQVHYIIGLPAETRPQINRTLEHVARLAEAHGAEPLVQFATPVPGTALHRECVQRGCLTADPDRLDLLALFESRSLIRGEHFTPRTLQAFRAALQRRLDARIDPPLLLEVSSACNDRCGFCSAAGRSAHTPALSALERRLRAAADEGIRAVDLDGGEPTLHPELERVVATARALGYERINLVTNGRRAAYPGYARALARAGLSGALVSVPAAEAETHDRLTRVRGSFEQTAAGLRNLLDAGLRHVHGNVVLCAAALPRLGDTVRWLADQGVSGIHLQGLLALGAARCRDGPPPWADVRRALLALPAVDVPLTLHNVPPCRRTGRLIRLGMETVKRGRPRIDARGRRVDFGEFLARLRVRRPSCEPCVHRVECDGFWRWDAPDREAAA